MIKEPYRIDVKDIEFMTAKERKAAEALVRRGQAVYCDDAELVAVIDPRWKEAREHLTPFCEETGPWLMEPWQDVINDRLTEMVVGKEQGQRLLLHAPPQNGKSIITSQRFPAFILGHDPNARVRLACYNETHAEAFGEVVQQVMRSEEYSRIFPGKEHLIPERSPKGRWFTAARSERWDAQPSFIGMGLNTGFVGQGADWLIIDDPYKSRDEAFSDTINERIWRFWSVTAKQRLSPHTNVVVIFHRWAQNDLAGRLMDEGDWEVMRFPALCDGKMDDPTFALGIREKGENLTPRIPKEHLEELKEDDPLTFAALQQGDPMPEGGQQFLMDRLKEHDILPESPSLPLLDVYQGVDLAISLKTTADFTAVATIGVSGDQDLYILDINFERVGFNAALDKIESEAIEWGGKDGHEVIGIGIETTAYQLSAFEEASRRYFLPFTEVKPRRDKLSRAQLFIRRVAMGKCFVNMNAEWWPELRRQMLGVADATVKDDLLDAIVNALEQLPVSDDTPLAERLPAPDMSAAQLEEEIELADWEDARTKLN